MKHRFAIPEECDWLNYIRCHDDIGWAFADDDVEAVGQDPKEHRGFLTRFYSGRHEGGFARGATFQEDPRTGDARISGTCASLAGIEQALADGDDDVVDLAVRRVLLLHGVILTIGGIPMIYLGDEIAMLNDYGYDADPVKDGDSRWLHRAPFDWERAEQRRDAETVPGRVFQGLLRLIQLRKQNQAFRRAETQFLETGNQQVFAYTRSNEEQDVFVLANFSERAQSLEARRLRQMGMRKTMVDLHAGRTITAARELTIEPYQLMVLARVGG
jgi:amylosucrase/maltose alpha-D-glucosyltransferase/alpha-amylase